MKHNKILAALLTASMAMSLVACSKTESKPAEDKGKTETSAAQVEETKDGTVEISLWTFPIGSWKDAAVVDGFIADFNKDHPNIKVNVEYIDYKSGDDQVTAALEANTAPDIIFEGPERLVANWGVKGKMVELSDLWTDEAKQDIDASSPAIQAACKTQDGKYYEYPICMTTHCMAINRDVFEKAGALQYIDEANHTWTTENFVKAMKAVADSKLVNTPGIVYCGGQGGDQGTRALVTNLYGAKFTDDAHTKYTIDSEEGIKALTLINDMVKDGSLSFDSGIAAGEAIDHFVKGTTATTYCWNSGIAGNNAEKLTFTALPMAFPTATGKPELAGGIWGFGIFNNGNDAKIAAAKEFIKFIADNKEQGPKSVYATGFFPVRSSFGDIYKGTEHEQNTNFANLMPFLGDYYQVTTNWAEQRTAWFNMLQQIFAGTDVKKAAAAYVAASNGAK